jgi:putative hydrolase of the HAD superfamily
MTLSVAQNDRRRNPPPIRAVILDYGDVISQPAEPAVIAKMTAMFRVPEHRFRHLYGSFRLDYDRGTLSANEYWTKIAQAAGTELSTNQIAELRRDDVAMWSRLNVSILRWVDQLRAAGMRTAVLSNMHDDMVQHVRANGDWTKSFDCVTLSSAIHMAKPDTEIFNYCLKCLEVDPDEALFVDDRERNVQAARALGMRGIVAPSPEHLRTNLQAIGFVPLPQ